MNKLPTELYDMETALYLAIAGITAIALILFFLSLCKRLIRLKRSVLERSYQKVIDAILFDYLFNERSIEDVISSSGNQKHFRNKLFLRLTIKSVVALHDSYSGVYSRKLEEFFGRTPLADYSLKKLNSRKWPDIVEGIRFLSEMNYQPAYPRIVSYKKYKNKFVQVEVLLGMIMLKGLSELTKFQKSGLYLNDWVQSNILFTVKKHNLNPPAELPELLKSKNKSLVLLAVRLINYYKLTEHYDVLSEFYQKTKDQQLKKEIAGILKKTEQIF